MCYTYALWGFYLLRWSWSDPVVWVFNVYHFNPIYLCQPSS